MRVAKPTSSERNRFFYWEFKKKSSKKFIQYCALSILASLALFSILLFRAFDDSLAYYYYKEKYPLIIQRYEHERYSFYRNLLLKSLATNTSHLVDHIADQKILPRLNLNIDFKHLTQIRKDRKRALEGGEYQRRERSYVPVQIQYLYKTLPANIRLKGGRKDHVEHPTKWSFRVKLKGESRFLGMKNFSLQAPFTRNYQYEPLFLETARDLGLVAVRYHFVDAYINGESIGIMAAEEHFTKELLEAHGRREGVICKINDQRVHESYFALQEHRLHDAVLQEVIDRDLPHYFRNVNLHITGPFAGIGLQYYNALNSPIEVFEKGKVLKSPTLRAQRQLAIGLLRGAFQGEIPIEEVFDTDLFGAYFANLWLWTAPHSGGFSNQRFYFNPVSSKFEPIAFDAGAFATEEVSMLAFDVNQFDTSVTRLIFSSPSTQEAFKKYADKLYRKVTYEAYLEELKEKEDSLRRALAIEYHTLPPLNLEHLKNHAVSTIRAIRDDTYFTRSEPVHFTPHLLSDLQLPDIADIFYSESVEGLKIEVVNLLSFPIELTELTIREGDIELENDLPLPVTIPATDRTKTGSRLIFAIKRKHQELPITIQGVGKPVHQEKSYQIHGRLYPKAKVKHPLSSWKPEQVTEKYPSIKYSLNNNQFTFPEGTHTINDLISFPKGASITIEKGTIIQLSEDAGLIIHGGLTAKGTSDKPISFQPTRNFWKGVAVLEPETKTSLSYVTVQGTSGMSSELWNLTGGITFYKSRTPIDIQHSKFIDTTAEDALNIISSEMRLDSIHIIGTTSDAFDGDFVSGTINNSNFTNVKGDAVDVSGSNITVTKSTFESIHDKALSIGEKSQAIAKELTITNAGVGAVAKDKSSLQIANSSFHDIQYATLMSYQKKPEYGGGELIGKNLKMQKSENSVLIQEGSFGSLDGEELSPQKLDIDKLYSSGFMKKR